MRRALILQTITFGILLAVVIVLATEVDKNRQLAVSNRNLVLQGQQAHDALCVFKNDLAGRIVEATEFLGEHPDGIAGIPASVIQNSLANQQAALDSLADLICPPTKGS